MFRAEAQRISLCKKCPINPPPSAPPLKRRMELRPPSKGGAEGGGFLFQLNLPFSIPQLLSSEFNEMMMQTVTIRNKLSSFAFNQ